MILKAVGNNIIKGIAAMMACSLCVSLAAAGTKYVSAHLPLHVIIFVQYSIGFLFTAPLLMRKGLQGVKTKHGWLHLIRGASGLGSLYAFYFTLTRIQLVEATLLRNSSPLWIPIILQLWLKIKIPRRRWLPLFIGFLGVIFILRPAPNTIGLWHLAGISSAILIGVNMITTRLLVHTETNTLILFYYYSLAVPITLPLAIRTWQPAPGSTWGVLAATGLLLYLAMNFYALAFRYAKPSIISPISFFGVVFAGLWGWVFWNQIPMIWTYLGIVLVVTGAVLILIKEIPDVQLLPHAIRCDDGSGQHEQKIADGISPKR